MASELTGWKAKIYDLVREIDKLDNIELQPVSQLRDMYTLIDTMEEQIDTMKQECPAEWSVGKSDIEESTRKIKEIWEDTTLLITKEAPYNA
jgi:hypothetical protein